MGVDDPERGCLHLEGAVARKVRDVLAMLHADGWVLVVQRGSHRQFKHPQKRGRVTVAGKPADDLPPGTLASILKQARRR
jgi:predicted RNA binding protein YcfA (HicA-like mRNA interferase family)